MGYYLTEIKLSQGFSVAKLHCLVDNNSQLNLFVWDPTELVATRPRFMLSNPGSYKFFYTFDGNKNVSELVHFESRNGIAAHYDYAPFGAVTRAVNNSAISARNFHLDNPFRFSSEYHDDTLGLVYYNYRHYNPIDGRWTSRDVLEEDKLYSFCCNSPWLFYDWFGLFSQIFTSNVFQAIEALKVSAEASNIDGNLTLPLYDVYIIDEGVDEVCDAEFCPVSKIRFDAYVKLKVSYDFNPPFVKMPTWGYKFASKEEIDLFNAVSAIIREHEQTHVDIWEKYALLLPSEIEGTVQSCSNKGLLMVAKNDVIEKLNAEYEAFVQKFTNENNQFQKYDEKYGRHQIVDEMIENYRKQLKEKQQ